MSYSTIFRTALILFVCFKVAGAGPGGPLRGQDETSPFDSRSLDVVSILSLLSSFLTKASLTKLATTITTAKLAAIGYALLIKLKPVMVGIGALYIVSVFLGFMFPNSVIASTMRSLETSVMDQVTNNVNTYDPVELAFDYMKVEMKCRERTACEMGQYVAKEYPVAAGAFRLFGENLNHRYAKPVLRGARLFSDCQRLYPDCPTSSL